MTNIPPLRLPNLTSRWTQSDLGQALASAQKTPGRVIQTPYGEKGIVYVLAVICPAPSRDLRLRKETASSIEPHWTLTKENDNGPPTHLWTYSSRDQGLILNFIYAELDGPAKQSTFTTPTPTPMTQPRPAGQAPGRPQPGAFKTIEHSNASTDVTLAGDLAKMELSNVLQSIAICRMTGRLDFNSGTHQTEVFFDEGKLVHALAQDVLSLDGSARIVGEQAFLDLFTWTKGSFRFNPGWSTKESTVTRRMDALLLEGVTLQDHEAFLHKSGLTKHAFICQKESTLTEAELVKRLKDCAPIDLEQQLVAYEKIGSGLKMDDLLKLLAIPRTTLVPILFNLLTCNAVHCVNNLEAAVVPSKKVQIDTQAASQAALALVRNDTGIMNFPLFTHFLELELARMKDTDLPLSVVALEITNRGTPLSDMEMRQMLKRFELFKRPYDLVAHYQSASFLILLPFMNAKSARAKIDKFASMLLAAPLGEFDQFQELRIRIGVGGAPEDASDAVAILTCAWQSMNDAAPDSPAMSQVDWDILCARGDQAIKDEQFDTARKLWTEAKEKSDEFAQEDVRITYAVERLAQVLLSLNEHAEAESLLKTALERKTREYGATDLKVAETAYQLAHSLYVQKKFSEGEILANQFITIAEQNLGADHLLVAKGWYNLALLYHVQSKIDEAQLAYKKALEISRGAFGEEHDETIKIMKNMAKLLASRTGKSVFKDMTKITGTWKAIELNPSHELHRM